MHITLLLDYLGQQMHLTTFSSLKTLWVWTQDLPSFPKLLFFILPSPFLCMTLMSDTRVSTLLFSILQLYYILIWWSLNNCSQVFTSHLPLRRLFIAEHWCVADSANLWVEYTFLFHMICNDYESVNSSDECQLEEDSYREIVYFHKVSSSFSLCCEAGISY